MYYNKKYNFNNYKMTIKQMFEYLELDISDDALGSEFILYYRRMTNFVDSCGGKDNFKTDLSKPNEKAILRAMIEEITLSGRNKRSYEIILAILKKTSLENFIEIRNEIVANCNGSEDIEDFYNNYYKYYGKSEIFQYLDSVETEKEKRAEKEKDIILKHTDANNKNDNTKIKRRI